MGKEEEKIIYQGWPNIGHGALENWFININKKLDSMTNNLTQWDLYKIDYILTNPASLRSAMNNLLPNTALVVDTNTFNNARGESFHRGDLIFNDSQGQKHKINASRGSTYVPVKITKENTVAGNNNYIISYKQTNITPADRTINIDITKDQELLEKDICTNINFQGIQIDNATALYNININNINTAVPIKFPNMTTSESPKENILPVVKYYTIINQKGWEEVYWDEERQLIGEEWVINNIPPIITKVVAK